MTSRTAPEASHRPLLSIVTPSFNQGKYLERAILSVLEQKDPNLRYAVIDGGSTDESVEIIRKYEKHLDFWCSEPDGGQGAAIVKGFQRIGGDIRGWLNSDDEYVPGAFRHVRKAFARSPSLGLIYGNRILIDADSHVLGWTRYGSYEPRASGYMVASETAFWTAAAEEHVGPIDTSLRFAMDLDFFTRIYLAEHSAKIDDYLGKFRCHDESKSATISDVGDQETAMIWGRLFGSSETWKVQARHSPVQHALAGIRHPFMLGIPYMKQKLRARAAS